jgi:hypothetical protein
MDQVMYSHDDVWLLIQSLQTMDITRREQSPWWHMFEKSVCQETANAYSPEWDTASVICKMADDLGSFKLLLGMWIRIEDAMNEHSVITDK